MHSSLAQAPALDPKTAELFKTALSRAALRDAAIVPAATEVAPPKKEEEMGTGTKIALAAGAGVLLFGAWKMFGKGGRMARECGTCSAFTPPADFTKKPLTKTAKLGLGIGAAAVAGAAVVASSAWATGKKGASGPLTLSLTSAQSGGTFAVKPGTVIYMAIPGEGWSGQVDQGGVQNTPVQFGEGSGPYPAQGGEVFMAQAVFPGASTLTFTNPRVGGSVQFNFVVVPSR